MAKVKKDAWKLGYKSWVESQDELTHEVFDSQVRTFETGATRDSDKDKLDYEGFLSPLVLERFAEFMHKHRIQSDGNLRASDNWQKGIPQEQYMKSMFRHFMEVWKMHRQNTIGSYDMENALCALMFNVMGMLHEYMTKYNYNASE